MKYRVWVLLGHLFTCLAPRTILPEWTSELGEIRRLLPGSVDLEGLAQQKSLHYPPRN